MRGDMAGPIPLPEQFWADDTTIEVLAQRDIGQLFRIVQRTSGATQTRVGVAVGLSQAQVSEIMSGSRNVSSVDVLSRIVSGLDIPEPARSVLFLGDARPAGTRLVPLQMSDDDAHGSADIVAAYAMRGLIPRPKWNDTIRNAREHLWLYGMAELGYALDDEVPTIVAEAAQRGCDIRVLLLDPASSGAALATPHRIGDPPGSSADMVGHGCGARGEMCR